MFHVSCTTSILADSPFSPSITVRASNWLDMIGEFGRPTESYEIRSSQRHLLTIIIMIIGICLDQCCTLTIMVRFLDCCLNSTLRSLHQQTLEHREQLLLASKLEALLLLCSSMNGIYLNAIPHSFCNSMPFECVILLESKSQ